MNELTHHLPEDGEFLVDFCPPGAQATVDALMRRRHGFQVNLPLPPKANSLLRIRDDDDGEDGQAAGGAAAGAATAAGATLFVTAPATPSETMNTTTTVKTSAAGRLRNGVLSSPLTDDEGDNESGFGVGGANANAAAVVATGVQSPSFEVASMPPTPHQRAEKAEEGKQHGQEVEKKQQQQQQRRRRRQAGEGASRYVGGSCTPHLDDCDFLYLPPPLPPSPSPSDASGACNGDGEADVISGFGGEGDEDDGLSVGGGSGDIDSLGSGSLARDDHRQRVATTTDHEEEAAAAAAALEAAEAAEAAAAAAAVQRERVERAGEGLFLRLGDSLLHIILRNQHISGYKAVAEVALEHGFGSTARNVRMERPADIQALPARLADAAAGFPPSAANLHQRQQKSYEKSTKKKKKKEKKRFGTPSATQLALRRAEPGAKLSRRQPLRYFIPSAATTERVELWHEL